MAFYLLNISVDTADPNPSYVPENLAFNDQESIIEIIVEQVLGFENAIKEYDDQDSEEHNKKKEVKIELLVSQIETDENTLRELSENKKIDPGHEARLTNRFKEIDSPPPKV